MSDRKPKALKEVYAQFLEGPSRERLRDLLQNHLGEQKYCDFKKAWPQLSGLARHILGMANSGGGCIHVGVEEKQDGTFDPVGLPKLLDKAEFENGVRSYMPDPLSQEVEVQDFAFEETEYAKLKGKRFQVVFVGSDVARLPYVSMREGKDIRAAAVYVRHQAASVEASYPELQDLINQRLATGYSSAREITIKHHLDELKMLYGELQRLAVQPRAESETTQSPTRTVILAVHPSESYYQFVARLLRMKKKRILLALELLHPYAYEPGPLGE